jgi:hypothetical protein
MFALPNMAEYFSAQSRTPAFLVRHDALGGRENGDTETRPDRLDLPPFHVYPSTWFAHASHGRDHGHTVSYIPEPHAQHGVPVCSGWLEVDDEALGFQDPQDFGFQPGGRDHQRLMTALAGVLKSDQEIGYRIGDHSKHSISSFFNSLLSPAGLRHAWNFPTEAQIAEANPAHPEPPQKTSHPAAERTAVVAPHLEFIVCRLLEAQGLSCHRRSSYKSR